MTITPQDIDAFKVLYKEHFGVVLTNEKARLKLMKLVLQIEMTYQPLTSEDIRLLIETTITRTRDKTYH